MTSNYHTHTRWCRHGTGEIGDYAWYGARIGLSELAITEHVPLPGDPDLRRMRFAEFPAFDAELNGVIAEYKGKIKILKGFECEYYPWLLEDYRKYKEEYGYGILMLGQHVNSERTLDNFRATEPWQLAIYAAEICEGLESGVFDFLAHPDVVMFGYGKVDESMLEAMDQIFKKCKKLDIPVEINASGFKYNRGHPNREIWKLAKGYGLSCIISADAHHVDELSGEHIIKAEKFAADLGLKVLEKLPEGRKP